MRNDLRVVESELEGREWFMETASGAPSRVDMLYIFTLGMGSSSGLFKLEEYPNIKGWLERAKARPAWERSLEKGNGWIVDWPAKYR